MDQLTAYKVLGLEPNSTPEEVKSAYATLSKQYHPEEHPDEFQKIHEAYVTLTRRRPRGGAQTPHREEQTPYHEEQTPHREEQTPHREERTSYHEERTAYHEKPAYQEAENTHQNEQQADLNFEGMQYEREAHVEPETVVETEDEQEYSFEEAMQKAQMEEQAKSHELVLEAAAELKLLVSPKYKHDLKAFKAFFEDKKYETIIKRADFLEKLCDVLEESKLKKPFYHYMIDFYRLRGYDPNELSQVGLRLYQILDEKAGMKKPVNPGIYGGVAAGIIAGLRAARPAIRGNQALSMIVLLVVLVALGVLVYKKLRGSHSSLLWQAVIAIVLIVSQFAVIMTDFYGTIFGTVDDGILVATLIMMAALAWLVAVIAAAIIKAIIRLIKRY